MMVERLDEVVIHLPEIQLPDPVPDIQFQQIDYATDVAPVPAPLPPDDFPPASGSWDDDPANGGQGTLGSSGPADDPSDPSQGSSDSSQWSSDSGQWSSDPPPHDRSQVPDDIYALEGVLDQSVDAAVSVLNIQPEPDPSTWHEPATDTRGTDPVSIAGDIPGDVRPSETWEPTTSWHPAAPGGDVEASEPMTFDDALAAAGIQVDHDPNSPDDIGASYDPRSLDPSPDEASPHGAELDTYDPTPIEALGGALDSGSLVDVQTPVSALDDALTTLGLVDGPAMPDKVAPAEQSLPDDVSQPCQTVDDALAILEASINVAPQTELDAGPADPAQSLADEVERQWQDLERIAREASEAAGHHHKTPDDPPPEPLLTDDHRDWSVGEENVFTAPAADGSGEAGAPFAGPETPDAVQHMEEHGIPAGELASSAAQDGGTDGWFLTDGDIDGMLRQVEALEFTLGDLREVVPNHFHIDEPEAVAGIRGGAWDDPDNKRFLDPMTNSATKRDFEELRPRPRLAPISLREAKAAGPGAFREAALAMLDRRFSEVRELAAITAVARAGMRELNHDERVLKTRINRSIRLRILRGSSEDAALVRDALDVIGLDIRTSRPAVPAKNSSAQRSKG